MASKIDKILPLDPNLTKEQLLALLQPEKTAGFPAFFPIAYGWWVLLGIIGLIYLARRVYFNSYGYKLRMQVLTEIEAAGTEAADDMPRFAAKLSEILKRAAIIVYGKEHLAPTYGIAWIKFLIYSRSKRNKKIMRNEIAGLIAAAPYMPVHRLVKNVPVADLKAAALSWVKINL